MTDVTPLYATVGSNDPARAMAVDGMSVPGQELTLTGDAVSLDFSAGELVRMKVAWT